MAGINVYLRKRVPRMLPKMLNLLRNMTVANNDVINGVDSYLVSCDNVCAHDDVSDNNLWLLW